MARKRYTAEEIIGHLREAEVALAQGQPVGAVVRTLGISEPTYDRWRRESGGLRVDQATRLQGLERENSRLKRLRASSPSPRASGAPAPAASPPYCARKAGASITSGWNDSGAKRGDGCRRNTPSGAVSGWRTARCCGDGRSAPTMSGPATSSATGPQTGGPSGCGPSWTSTRGSASAATSPGGGGATTDWPASPSSSSRGAHRPPSAPTPARRAPRERCAPGFGGAAGPRASSHRAVPGRTALGNPAPARSATRVAIRRSSPPCPRPRSASSAGAGRTTRSGPTAPSAPARPPQTRWRSDLPTPPPGQTGGAQHSPQHWHNNRGRSAPLSNASRIPDSEVANPSPHVRGVPRKKRRARDGPRCGVSGTAGLTRPALDRDISAQVRAGAGWACPQG